MLIAGDAPRFIVSVPYKCLKIRSIEHECFQYFHHSLPEPDPEFVDVELLPGEGVPGSGRDRA